MTSGCRRGRIRHPGADPRRPGTAEVAAESTLLAHAQTLPTGNEPAGWHTRDIHHRDTRDTEIKNILRNLRESSPRLRALVVQVPLPAARFRRRKMIHRGNGGDDEGGERILGRRRVVVPVLSGAGGRHLACRNRTWGHGAEGKRRRGAGSDHHADHQKQQ